MTWPLDEVKESRIQLVWIQGIFVLETTVGPLRRRNNACIVLGSAIYNMLIAKIMQIYTIGLAIWGFDLQRKQKKKDLILVTHQNANVFRMWQKSI